MAFSIRTNLLLSTVKPTTGRGSLAASLLNISNHALASILQDAPFFSYFWKKSSSLDSNQIAVSSSSSSSMVVPYHPCWTDTHRRVHNLQLLQFPLQPEISISDYDNGSIQEEEMDMDMERKDNATTDHPHDIIMLGRSKEHASLDILTDLSMWLISTLKRRKKKMNKHKLRKRRKLERLKSRK